MSTHSLTVRALFSVALALLALALIGSLSLVYGQSADTSRSYSLRLLDARGTATTLALTCYGAGDITPGVCYLATPATPATPATTPTTVYLPTATVFPPLPTPAPSVTPTTGPSYPVRVNFADLATLDTLPHVGAVIAQRMIDARPILDCADGDGRVKGWGVAITTDACPLMDFSR